MIYIVFFVLDEKLAELQKLQLEYEKEREQNQEEMRALTKRHELEVDITVKNCEDKLEQSKFYLFIIIRYRIVCLFSKSNIL